MLFGVYEFEVFEEEGGYVAGTQGDTFEELCEMVADWLRVTLEDYDIRGEEPPAPTFGNAPRYGGTNTVFAVAAGRETVEKVTASEAARMLGVSPGRVTQMIAANQLYGWREGRNTYVTVDSVSARAAEQCGAGRPRKASVA